MIRRTGLKVKKKKIRKLKALDMEVALSGEFNYRANLVVPNISWGMFRHECDLFVLTPAGCGWEIEIKVSRSDLIKDKEKRHGHFSEKIRLLYFAIPDYLQDCIEHVPERAGIILVDQDLRCRTIRAPKQNGNYKFTDKERYQVARLAAMRIWGLKKKLLSLKNK